MENKYTTYKMRGLYGLKDAAGNIAMKAGDNNFAEIRNVRISDADIESSRFVGVYDTVGSKYALCGVIRDRKGMLVPRVIHECDYISETSEEGVYVVTGERTSDTRMLHSPTYHKVGLMDADGNAIVEPDTFDKMTGVVGGMCLMTSMPSNKFPDQKRDASIADVRSGKVTSISDALEATGRGVDMLELHTPKLYSFGGGLLMVGFGKKHFVYDTATGKADILPIDGYRVLELKPIYDVVTKLYDDRVMLARTDINKYLVFTSDCKYRGTSDVTSYRSGVSFGGYVILDKAMVYIIDEDRTVVIDKANVPGLCDGYLRNAVINGSILRCAFGSGASQVVDIDTLTVVLEDPTLDSLNTGKGDDIYLMKRGSCYMGLLYNKDVRDFMCVGINEFNKY